MTSTKWIFFDTEESSVVSIQEQKMQVHKYEHVLTCIKWIRYYMYLEGFDKF